MPFADYRDQMTTPSRTTAQAEPVEAHALTV